MESKVNSNTAEQKTETVQDLKTPIFRSAFSTLTRKAASCLQKSAELQKIVQLALCLHPPVENNILLPFCWNWFLVDTEIVTLSPTWERWYFPLWHHRRLTFSPDFISTFFFKVKRWQKNDWLIPRPTSIIDRTPIKSVLRQRRNLKPQKLNH